MAEAVVINWEGQETHYLVHERWPLSLKNLAFASITKLPERRSHIWVPSSGTQKHSGFKWVALHKNAFLEASQSVNGYIEASKKDVWLNSLPTTHVAGLSVYSRARLTGSDVIDLGCLKWDPRHWVTAVQENRVSLASLVPAQVYDLLVAGLTSPESLRSIFVGGAPMSADLFIKARNQKWPLVCCYGMTETAAMIAVGDLEKRQKGPFDMHILPHAKIGIEMGHIRVWAKSLTKLVAHVSPEEVRLEEINVDQGYMTSDMGVLSEGRLTVTGRADHQVKILGELVNLDQVSSLLSKACLEIGLNPRMVQLRTEDHPRKGFELKLAIAETFVQEEIQRLLKIFNQEVLPPCRINETIIDENLGLGVLDKQRFSD